MINWTELFIPHASIIETVVRGSIIYLSLFSLLRLVLKRQSSTLGVTDLLVIVLIADASQSAMGSNHESIGDSLILVMTILFWAFCLDWLGYKIPTFQKFLRPPELILVKDGKIMWKNMRRELVTEDELMSQIRLTGCGELKEVKRAFMEGDGRISVISKSSKVGSSPPEKTLG